MIEQELILLGLLKDSPKHGYEIKKKIKEIPALFAGTNLKSIYYPLRILEKDGLVIKRINQSGKRPQRLVYALTKKGESKFHDLLTKSLLDFKRPQFSLDLSLYFLHYLKPEIARRRLRARTQVLKKLSRVLRQMGASRRKKRPLSLAYILEHDLQMVEAESSFLANLIRTL
jgi:DNA-binding PadR family transcriptional regulator